jgi:hypothetical protein
MPNVSSSPLMIVTEPIWMTESIAAEQRAGDDVRRYAPARAKIDLVASAAWPELPASIDHGRQAGKGERTGPGAQGER